MALSLSPRGRRKRRRRKKKRKFPKKVVFHELEREREPLFPRALTSARVRVILPYLPAACAPLRLTLSPFRVLPRAFSLPFCLSRSFPSFVLSLRSPLPFAILFFNFFPARAYRPAAAIEFTRNTYIHDCFFPSYDLSLSLFFSSFPVCSLDSFHRRFFHCFQLVAFLYSISVTSLHLLRLSFSFYSCIFLHTRSTGSNAYLCDARVTYTHAVSDTFLNIHVYVWLSAEVESHTSACIKYSFAARLLRLYSSRYAYLNIVRELLSPPYTRVVNARGNSRDPAFLNTNSNDRDSTRLLSIHPAGSRYFFVSQKRVIEKEREREERVSQFWTTAADLSAGVERQSICINFE